MLYDGHINNLAKNQVAAVFHSRVIFRNASPNFIELSTKTPCEVTEKSVTEFCY